MLEFHPLELQDITALRPYFRRRPNRICDSSIGGAFIWRDYLKTKYAVAGDTLFLQSQLPEDGSIIYSVPLGGDVQEALLQLKAHCDAAGHGLTLSAVAAEDLPYIQDLWPEAEVKLVSPWSDYLYHAEDLKELTGKKYATQRNHISKFNRLYPEWRFTPITADNLEEVRAFFAWFAEVNEKDSATYREDEKKAAEVLDHFALYGFIGGAIWVEDRIIAMALGEVQEDTLYVHIEKADTRYHGAYQMIVQQFAKYACTDGVRFINREDDAGDEGLRRSKLAWRPCALLDKHLVHID